MANIEKELRAIMEAEYGEEVRSSIHDAIKAGNDEIVTYGFKEEERSQAEADRVAAENARAAAEGLREEAKAAASVSFTWISWWTKRFICSMPIPSP